MEFVGGLIPLLVLIAIASAIVSAFSRRRSSRTERGPGVGAKQVFLYLFSFAALMVTASGASLLVTYIVDQLADERFASSTGDQLALGIALTIVGTPAWLITWRHLWRSASASVHERTSDIRGFYIYLVLLVSVGFIIGGSISLLEVILGSGSFEGTDISFPLVWGALWGYHWWIELRLQPEERAATPFRSLYVYVVSLGTLILLLTGIAVALFRLLDSAYANLFLDDSFLTPDIWSGSMQTGIAVALVGGVGWWWHWFRTAAAEPPTVIRQLYNYVFGVLAGVATVVVSLSILLVIVLQWAFDTPTISPPGEHFRQVMGLIPAILAGSMLWGFHAAVARSDASESEQSAAERIYRHIVSGLSLATLATGLVFLFALFVSATSRDARNYIVDDKGWQGQLAIVIPVLVVGAGLWAYHWSKLQQLARADITEISAASRRIHIYSVFGISALLALGSLSATVFLVLDALLDSGFGASTLRDVQWPLGILVTTGVVSGYYWMVIRQDRRTLADAKPVEPQVPARPRKEVTVMLPSGSERFARDLERLLGYEVTMWIGTDGEPAVEPGEDELAAVAQRIDAAPGEAIFVIAVGGRLEVRPYRHA